MLQVYNTEGFATVKYDSTGVQQWVQFYNGPGNNASEVTFYSS